MYWIIDHNLLIFLLSLRFKLRNFILSGHWRHRCVVASVAMQLLFLYESTTFIDHSDKSGLLLTCISYRELLRILYHALYHSERKMNMSLYISIYIVTKVFDDGCIYIYRSQLICSSRHKIKNRDYPKEDHEITLKSNNLTKGGLHQYPIKSYVYLRRNLIVKLILICVTSWMSTGLSFFFGNVECRLKELMDLPRVVTNMRIKSSSIAPISYFTLYKFSPPLVYLIHSLPSFL